MTDQDPRNTAASPGHAPMTTVNSPEGYRVITVEEAEERFRISDEVTYPYAEFTEEQEIRLYEGGLHVAGHLKPEGDKDWIPYNTVVDGDLTVDGDLDWWDDGSGNFLVVTGNLRARNVFLSGCPNTLVRGNLEVTGGVCGSYGDDGGILTVRGSVHASTVISVLYFGLDLAEQPQALLVADTCRTNRPVDFTDDELDRILLPELLGEDGEAEIRLIERAMSEGRQVLRAGARPSHVIALEELDLLLDRADEVTELDLSGRKLRGFPEQLLAFPRLRVLSLANNADLGALDARIGELTALEELDVSGTGLTGLPESIGALHNLRMLDVSGNGFTELPDSLCDLGQLEVLRAGHLTCPLPDRFDRLRSLRELDLSRLNQGHYYCDTPVAFPEAVTRLTGLRSLDLSNTWLESVPDALLDLTALEELNLNHCPSDRLTRLPELARLPRLRVLRISGHTPWAEQPPASRDLLTGIWDITTLEHLEIDRWGQETYGGEKVRTVFRSLPEDAFARTPNLRRIDLSFNELTTLPEPFFALRRLEFADLQATRLDRPTLDRLRATFPRTRLDLRSVVAEEIVHDPNWQAVHTLVEEGSGKGPEEAVAAYEKAIALCTPGACYSDHDQLYAHYALVNILGDLGDKASDADRPALHAELVRYAEQAMSLLPDTVWHFTAQGAFQEEVRRRTGNALAWHLLHSGEPERALVAVEQALTADEDSSHDFVRDTQVRVLLALDRTDDAYRVVDQVLTRDPDSEDFTDLAALPEFQRWRQAQRIDKAFGGSR
ncbi:leucine-rich repeat domain-containing protein [Streptomyces sp. NPDC001732]